MSMKRDSKGKFVSEKKVSTKKNTVKDKGYTESEVLPHKKWLKGKMEKLFVDDKSDDQYTIFTFDFDKIPNERKYELNDDISPCFEWVTWGKVAKHNPNFHFMFFEKSTGKLFVSWDYLVAWTVHDFFKTIERLKYGYNYDMVKSIYYDVIPKFFNLKVTSIEFFSTDLIVIREAKNWMVQRFESLRPAGREEKFEFTKVNVFYSWENYKKYETLNLENGRQIFVERNPKFQGLPTHQPEIGLIYYPKNKESEKNTLHFCINLLFRYGNDSFYKVFGENIIQPFGYPIDEIMIYAAKKVFGINVDEVYFKSLNGWIESLENW